MRPASLPITDSMRPRPVERRRLTRQLLREGRFVNMKLQPPSDEDCYDAIRVLEDPTNQWMAPELYLEAERIFWEAGE